MMMMLNSSKIMVGCACSTFVISAFYSLERTSLDFTGYFKGNEI